MQRILVVSALIPTLLLQLAWPAFAVETKESDRPGSPRPRRFTYDAPNGFQVDVDSRKAGSSGFVASATVTAPGGETMTFDFADGGSFGPSVLVDGELLLGYQLTRGGQVRAITFDDGSRTLRSLRAAPPHRQDAEAYLALAGEIAARHSPEFLRGIEVALRSMQSEAAVPAQLRDWIECALGITGYVVSIWGLVTGCVVAGVPTLGASCLFAIIAHEAAVASAILSCFP